MIYDILNPRKQTVTREIKWADDVIDLYWDRLYPVDAVKLAEDIGIKTYVSTADNFVIDKDVKTSIILSTEKETKEKMILINETIKEDLGDADGEIIANALVAIVLGAYFCNNESDENANWALDYSLVHQLLDNTAEINVELMFAADLLLPAAVLPTFLDMTDNDLTIEEQAEKMHVPIALLTAFAAKLITEQEEDSKDNKNL